MAQKLNPFSSRQFIDANGDPYSGAQLFVYTAGSSTKTTVTKDSAGSSAHANPIILNSKGEPGDGAGAAQAIWQAEGVSVKFVLAPSTDTDPPVAAIESWDNIAGINDTTVSIDQWVSGAAPTYVSATSFTLVGDQTSDFHVGRRIKTTNTGGTIYSTIITSAYTSLTTITVVNDSGALDSGLSAVSYGLVSSDNSSISSEAVVPVYGPAVASATALPWPAYGNYSHVTGTTAITSFVTSGQVGKVFYREFDGALTLTHHATNLILPSAANITTAAGDVGTFIEYGSGTVKCINYQPYTGYSVVPPTTAQGSSLVLLSTATASADASIDFTGIDSTYKNYVVYYNNLIPASDNDILLFRTSTDGGSTYDSGASDYKYACDGRGSGGVLNTRTSGAGTSINIVPEGIGFTAASEGTSGQLYLHNPSDAGIHTYVSGSGCYSDNAGNLGFLIFAGRRAAAEDVDAIRFIYASGNIVSGEFALYGIKDA